MSQNNFHQSLTFIQPSDHLDQEPDLQYLDFQQPRKKIKTDQYQKEDQQQLFAFDIQSEGKKSQNYNIYSQEFNNLKACSFRTISKIGLQKGFAQNRMQNWDNEANSISNRIKGQKSKSNMSEERIQDFTKKGVKNKIGNTQYCYGSLHELMLVEKKNSMNVKDEVNDENRRNSKKLSLLYSNSMNNINTEMMNELVDLNIKDQDEITELDLKLMTDTALIKNIKFTANILIQIKFREQKQLFYSNLRFYKILDFDGFTITGFYAESQKLRIKLHQPITNKQFDKKFVLQQPVGFRNIRNFGMRFLGTIYDRSNCQWDQIQIWFSEIRYNISPDLDRKQQRENINYSNLMKHTNVK